MYQITFSGISNESCCMRLREQQKNHGSTQVCTERKSNTLFQGLTEKFKLTNVYVY